MYQHHLINAINNVPLNVLFRLFLETINEHPDYKNVPIEERNLNYRALRDVLPKTEKIKTKLLEQYSTEYELYQEQKVNSILKLYLYNIKSIRQF